MKTTLDEINRRLDTAEEKISEPEDIAIETIDKRSQNNTTQNLVVIFFLELFFFLPENLDNYILCEVAVA